MFSFRGPKVRRHAILGVAKSSSSQSWSWRSKRGILRKEKRQQERIIISPPLQMVFSKELRDALVGVSSSEVRLKVLLQLQRLAQGKRPAFGSGDAQASEEYRDMIHVLHVHDRVLIWTVDVDRAFCTQVWALLLIAHFLVVSLFSPRSTSKDLT
jgi:hypothetical protein